MDSRWTRTRTEPTRYDPKSHEPEHEWIRPERNTNTIFYLLDYLELSYSTWFTQESLQMSNKARKQTKISCNLVIGPKS